MAWWMVPGADDPLEPTPYRGVTSRGRGPARAFGAAQLPASGDLEG